MRRFWTGAAAGCGFLLVELLARVLFGVPTLVELMQDRLIRLLPGPLFSLLLDRLLYLGKPLFFSGLLLLQLVLAGLGGLVVARWRRPWALVALLWMFTGLVLLPLAGRPEFAASPAVAVATAAAFAAYAAALVWFGAAQAAPNTGGALSPEAAATPADGAASLSSAEFDSDRRRLIGGGLAFLASVFLARQVVGNLPNLVSLGAQAASSAASSGSGGAPAAAPAPGAPPPGLPPAVTPVPEFYEVSKNLFNPVVDGSTWRLTVDGLVERTVTVNYSDILAMPAFSAYRTLECISNDIGGNLISNGHFTGARMADLLQRAGVKPGADLIHFTSVDGYTENMPLQQAMQPETLLAYKLDGKPLPSAHGFPLRVLGVGTYGMKNPKWLQRITLATSAPEGFWEQQGWSNTAIVQTMSSISTPGDGTVVRGRVPVGGIAFAGARGIRKVEVSADGGRTWAAARLVAPLSPYTWVLWWYTWTPAKPGEYQIAVRATDGTGVTQPARTTDTFPNGATGYDSVQVRVEA